ncbi:copper chaperone CopZ [Alpinimonas psychrophila]|uniref:Copper chaperone CopZ n=1 Tax=Alpinimonas psychrophila TaxID=748908 RepID=A0A7W3JS33_9MICO|nr:copper chaperone CopZ [Alpinimonas psychrophila]
MTTTTFLDEGMTCQHCINSVTTAGYVGRLA